MAYFAFKLERDLSGELHHGCGTFNVLRLDGRWSKDRAIQEALDWVCRTGGEGFELLKGKHLRDARKIYREVLPCNLEVIDRLYIKPEFL